jgi:hypothetical protein
MQLREVKIMAEKIEAADIGTAQDLARSTPEERAAAVQKLQAGLTPVDAGSLTTRERLERGIVVREDVSATTENEPNLKWVGIDEGGKRTRLDDPPRSLHIGRIDVYFNDDAILALISRRGVYSEHAAFIIGNVSGFKRPETKGGK